MYNMNNEADLNHTLEPILMFANSSKSYGTLGIPGRLLCVQLFLLFNMTPLVVQESVVLSECNLNSMIQDFGLNCCTMEVFQENGLF